MEASTIGIIGGADGPTSIFVAGESAALPFVLLALGAAAIILFVWLIRKNKKQK